MQRLDMKEPIHKHHIIPRHMGGTDDPSNLIELTVTEHAMAHLKLYEEYGKYEDLCAYLMLSGKNKDPEFIKIRASLGGKGNQKERSELGLKGRDKFYGRAVSKEEVFENCSKGGIIQGKINAENGHMKNIQKLSDTSAAGKKGGRATILSGKGAFGDPVQRLESCRKGGKVQGKRNSESGHLRKIAQMSIEENKRNLGMKWVTDGTTNMMIRKNQKIPKGFRKGKTQKK